LHSWSEVAGFGFLTRRSDTCSNDRRLFTKCSSEIASLSRICLFAARPDPGRCETPFFCRHCPTNRWMAAGNSIFPGKGIMLFEAFPPSPLGGSAIGPPPIVASQQFPPLWAYAHQRFRAFFTEFLLVFRGVFVETTAA